MNKSIKNFVVKNIFNIKDKEKEVEQPQSALKHSGLKLRNDDDY